MRNLCSAEVKDNRTQLNGIIEIDESLVAPIKYHRGSGLKRQKVWLFGLVERGPDSNCYLSIVPDRKEKTLLQLIYDHVEPDSTIMSDSWTSYNKLKHFKFNHLAVNHYYNFLDPETGAHTNKIEGLWTQFKKKTRKKLFHK